MPVQTYTEKLQQVQAIQVSAANASEVRAFLTAQGAIIVPDSPGFVRVTFDRGLETERDLRCGLGFWVVRLSTGQFTVMDDSEFTRLYQ